MQKNFEGFVDELGNDGLDPNQPDTKGRLPIFEATKTGEIVYVVRPARPVEHAQHQPTQMMPSTSISPARVTGQPAFEPSEQRDLPGMPGRRAIGSAAGNRHRRSKRTAAANPTA